MKAPPLALTALELALFRLRARRWFARWSLDAVLARQRPRSAAPGPGELAGLEREVVRVEAWLERAPRLRTTCLYRALARYVLLTRRGHPASFVLGIDPLGLTRPGHAWVEVGGRPFAESDDVSRFRVTFRYPPPVK